MIRIMSIQRFGLYGVVQYVEGGIIKAKNINPALSDAEIEARLQDCETAKSRDKGNADNAESDGVSGKTGVENAGIETADASTGSEDVDGKAQEPQGGCPVGEPGEPGTGPKIEELSLDELKAIAKELKIKGYGLFNREKLIAEISKGKGSGK